ncbi:MAG: 3-dehydroquinate synthase [Spirochaetes bacterium]|nr:3-dehydroquinate synthase [Spirochaetota bacterium]
MANVTRHINATAGGSAYEILIGGGILREAFLRKELSPFERIAVIAGSRVYELHRAYIEEALDVIRGRCRLIFFDDSEENKSYAYAGRFLEKFIEYGLNRKSAVIGIGGGVVGDFTGYCAGLFMRGIPVIHVPTTLLAMVDSSIGGKAAVNLSVGKNIAGVFRQPRMVVSDTLFLGTLPDGELRNGLTEALKHGLIGEPTTLGILQGNSMETIRREEVINRLVALSASFKAGIVEKDERESGLRAILNFGHTVGHAIESFMEYRGISHGGAVAAGIRVKMEAMRRMGLVSDGDAVRVGSLIDRYGLAERTPGLDIDGVIDHMAYDKKNFGGAVNFVLLDGLGKPKINQQIPADLLKEVMSETLT